MQINEIVDGFQFQSVTPQDKSRFMAVRLETSNISEAYQDLPEFIDVCWKMILEDDQELSMVVLRIPDELFVATCSFQRINCQAIELRYDVVKELRGHGIGTQMVHALIKLAHDKFPGREIMVKVRKDNIASRRIVEKCRGEFLRLEDSPESIALHVLLKFANEFPSAKKAAEAIEQGRDSIMVYRV